MKTALLAGVFACLAAPVFAQECEYEFDDTFASFEANGVTIVEVPDDRLDDLANGVAAATGAKIKDAERGFLANAHGQLILGLEVEGCLLPPIVLGFAPASQLSGKDENGNIGA